MTHMANGFTVADVLEWARTKPADAEYCYWNSDECALAQFGNETGRDYLSGLQSHEIMDIDEGLEQALVERDWTFGALVKRLEAIVQETPVAPSPWTDPTAYLEADALGVSA